MFRKEMNNPLIILFLLGAAQGLIGWIMVASGLNDENLYVNHIRLAIHFISALGLLVYAYWFAMLLLVPPAQHVVAPSLKKFTVVLLLLIVVQLVFGAFMAGLKAANFATTWPLINGEWIPSSMVLRMSARPGKIESLILRPAKPKRWRAIKPSTPHWMLCCFVYRP
jgi:cytochrome c oxidase assembly protein subunit 15